MRNMIQSESRKKLKNVYFVENTGDTRFFLFIIEYLESLDGPN